MGVRAVVVMPETAPAAKVEGVRRWDGEVVFAGTTSEDRYEKAILLAREQGLAVIPPFDHRDILAGQGTVGLEILEQLPGVTDVAVPVGGGGLAGGIAAALRARKVEVKLTTVEPEGSAALKAALLAGKPVRLERTHSIADGLLPLAVGEVPFIHLQNFAHPVTVTETAILEATRWLFYQQKLVVEPSGAVTTAALRSGVFRPLGPAVLVVSGGNVDPAAIARLA
jgi:threonine dehydratase